MNFQRVIAHLWRERGDRSLWRNGGMMIGRAKLKKLR
jgi:hypothetical protein